MPEHTVPAMRRAFNALKNGRPGPVMVEVPADVMTAEFAGNEVDYTAIRPTRSAGDPRDIDDAAKMLLEAKSPIIIAGQGVLYAEATDELLALAELLDIPVMTTTDGKSAFPEDHALALGSGGVVYTGHGRQFLLDSRRDLRDRHQPDPAQHLDPDHPAGQDDHPRHQRCARPHKANDTALADPRRRQAGAGAADRGGEGPARRQAARRPARGRASPNLKAGVARSAGRRSCARPRGRSTRIS